MKGHVYKRGTTWTYVVDLGKDPIEKKRVQKSRGGFVKKKDAELAMARVIAAQERATNTQEMTWWDLSEIWFEYYKQTSGNKESTFKKVSDDLVAIRKYFKDKVLLKDIDSYILEKYFIDLKDQYKKNTLHGHRGVLKMMFRYAKKMNFISQLPNFDFRLPKIAKKVEDIEKETDVPNYLEKDELLTLLEYTEDNCFYQTYALYHVLAYTGMRMGELCALKWTDIDFKEKTINIYKTLFQDGTFDGAIVQTAKSKTSQRIIDIDDDTLLVLKQLEKFQKEIKLASTKYHDQDYVFINTNMRHPGYHLRDQSIRYSLKRDLEAVGIKKPFTPHGFRHTHTSLMAEAGVDLPSISERLGHVDDTVTRRIYFHVTKQKKATNMSKFSEYMKKC